MANDVDGLAGLEKRFAKMLADVDPAGDKGLQDVALDLKGRSIVLAPIDKGDLRGSGYANRQPDGSWEVGFSEIYALIQHERLDFNHPKGGQAKYLEQPFRENIDRYIKHIGDVAKKAIEG